MSRRAIVYARISSDRADDLGVLRGQGVEDQERDARELAKRLGWSVVRVVTENDTSAFKRKRVTLPDGSKALRVVRPGFRSVLDDLVSDRADALIALDLDRAVRDPRDLEDLVDVVEQHHIPVESVTGSLRLASDADITMARVMVAMANKSSRDTGRRVSRAYRRRAEEGRYGGGKRIFGFDQDGVTIRPAEAAEVASAANRLLEGVSIREIALDLRRRAVPTVEGGEWTSASLRAILRRPRNAGLVVHRGELLEAAPTWQPILSREVHESVVRLLSDPDRMTSPGNTPTWLGSGLYRCACGGPMRVHGQERYRCSLVAVGHAVQKTGHSTIPAKRADLIVEDLILKRLAMPDYLDLFAPTAPDVDVPALRAEASALRARLTALAEDFADGVLNRAQLAAGTKRVEGRLREVEQTLAHSAGRSPLSPLLGSADVRKTWTDQPLSTRRAMLDVLIEVTIAPAVLGRRFDPARVGIRWKAN